MVIKGSARNAPGELAYHLLREDTNEQVQVLELFGVASLDLRGALAELDGMGAGSRSRRTLYHASINTPVSEQLDPEQQRLARERLAGRMGLEGQPYAVVQHVKHGRQHTHVVWSRINAETGRAIHDGFNYRKHEEVARELEQEFSHERVHGVHVRDKATEPRPARGPSWAEMRQAERSGMSPATAKAIVTEAWTQTTTGQGFHHRIEAEGFILARGDRRDFILIDSAGEVHGLTRRIDGVKAAQIRDRLADLDHGLLPDVAYARQQLRVRRQARDREAEQSFTSVSERLRAEELKREAEARAGNGPRLSNAHQEAADAIWQLNKTMRGQIETTVIAGPWLASDPVKTEGIDLPGRSSDAIQRFSTEAEELPDSQNPEVSPAVNEPRHQSVAVFIQIFGWVIDHYRRLLDGAIERKIKADPVREDVGGRRERQAETTPDTRAKRETFLDRQQRPVAPEDDSNRLQEERNRAAQQLRDELRRQHDGSRKRGWENET